VAAHKFQRRERPSGPWTDVGLAIDLSACEHAQAESETTLTNKERGKTACALPAALAAQTGTRRANSTADREWEYRVLAVNNAGEGQRSNTVLAVL
jgi:hypothetical protein